MASHWHLIDEHEIVWLIADHAAQRRLCTVLEGIADALPDMPTEERIRAIAQQLLAYSRRHVPLEAELFMRLSGQGKYGSAERILKEIRYNHAIDAIHAEDLAVELNRVSGTHRAAQPGELAYMLRCFFDGCRRAIAFEELALLTLGEERLTPAAKRAIAASFQNA